MITVFTSPDIYQAYSAKAILDDAGIKCVINNETTSYLAGALPHGDIWPQVDIFDESLAQKAMDLIRKCQEKELQIGEKWECCKCAEIHSPQFDSCWKCGNSKNQT